MNCNLSVSYSSALMTQVTLYRNQPARLNKVVAQFGYAAIAVAALIETLARLSFTAIALAIAPVDSQTFQHAFKIVQSCGFSFLWALLDLSLNPFVTKLVADEKSARCVLSSGKFLQIPQGALL